MKGRWILFTALALGLAFGLLLGTGLAQEPERHPRPRTELYDGGLVTSKISYQGVLKEDGGPVNGSRDMTFRLCGDDACTTQLGSDIDRPGVEVIQGLFRVELAFTNLEAWHAMFDGQSLWMQVEVEGGAVACQEVLPVPYALSLRPGAVIADDVPGLTALSVANTAEASGSKGLYVQTNSPTGRGVYAWALVDNGPAYAVYARCDSTEGAGVYSTGRDTGADLILGGNQPTEAGDDGRLHSDPAYESSDIRLVANDDVVVELNESNSCEEGVFEIQDRHDFQVFEVNDAGDVQYTGALVGAFPRPAYDSGWESLNAGWCATKNHNLGGDVDDYVVDLQFKDTEGSPPLMGIHNQGTGCDADGASIRGVFWRSLTNTSIGICRCVSDSRAAQFRVRIWVYR